MNYNILLLLIAFLSNMFLGFYILYKNPRDRLNLLFSLFVFAVSIWALGDFLVIISSTIEMAFFFNRVETIGSAAMSVFLLHFILILTKNKLLTRKIFNIPLFLFFYLPNLFFLYINFTSNLINQDMVLSDFEFVSIYGPLYNLFSLWTTMYVILSILLCYKFSRRIDSKKERNKIKIIIISISIPTIVGIITQVIPPIFGLNTIGITTTTTAIMVFIIAYAVFKYNLSIPKSFSIRKKLITGFLIISLLIGFVGYLSISITRDEFQKYIGEESISLGTQLLNKIDRNIYQRIEEFEYYCKLPIVRETILKSNQEFEKLENIQNYIDEKDNEWISVTNETITPFMRGLMNNTLAIALIERLKFYELRYEHELISEAFITNKYGVNVIQSGKTSDYYQADEEWWQKAKETGLYIEDIDYDESADVYSIDVCLRIDDESGYFLGIMKVVLNVEEIVSILKESMPVEKNHSNEMVHGLGKYSTMDLKLLTTDGKIIYATENIKLFTVIPEGPISDVINHSNELRDCSYFIASGDMPGEKEEIFAHAHSIGHRSYQGLGWCLIIEHETEEIFAPIFYLQNLIIAISIVIVLIGLIFGYIFSRSLSKPIIKLRDIAFKLGEGDLDAKIEINSKDEIQDLASYIKQMAIKLKNQQDNLENLVAGRTNELAVKVEELQRFKKITVEREIKMIELKTRIKELEGEIKNEGNR